MNHTILMVALCNAGWFLASPLHACELKAEKVGEIMGVEATTTADGVVRVGWARKDVDVNVDGLRLKPFMGLGSWAAFQKTEQGAMVMGDTVVFEDETNAAIDAAFKHNLEVTALHNHFFFDEPKVYFMHIGGEGCPDELAQGVRAVWDAVKKVRSQNVKPASRFAGDLPQPGELDGDRIAAIVGMQGTLEDGVYKVTIGRDASMHGVKFGGSMGLTTWAAFAGTDAHAAIAGDFAMTASEVQPVLRALRKADINIVALHNHMVGEQPAYYFVHFWGKGSTEALAKGFRVALDAQAAAGTNADGADHDGRAGAGEIRATKEFEIRNDRPFLGGQEIKLWGIRCGNALMSQAVTERHVRNLDNMVAHGINLVGVYIQGSNGGWPNAEAGKNGFEPDGTLKKDFAERLNWLISEADRRGMVVMVGIFSPRKDQELEGEQAVKRALEETAKFLADRKLKNVFVDIMHEYNHERIDMDIFREPNGAEKKAKLAAWFKKYNPDIEIGVCPTFRSGTGDEYSGMEVRMIQKEHPIPQDGFVVNVEMQRHDPYENDGKFEPEEFDVMERYFHEYRDAPNATLLFHSAFVQGITNKSSSAPHAEMGGYGRSENDRGVRFYYEWVRDNVGRYDYPRHIKAEK